MICSMFVTNEIHIQEGGEGGLSGTTFRAEFRCVFIYIYIYVYICYFVSRDMVNTSRYHECSAMLEKLENAIVF